MSIDNKQKGQTIVEILIAAGVVAVALTALVAIVTTSLSHNREAQERAIATRQAQEAIEWIRTIRDAKQTWGDFVSDLNSIGDGTGNVDHLCVGDISDPKYLYNFADIAKVAGDCPTYPVSNVAYKRKVTLAYDSVNNSVMVTVLVSWEAGSRTDSVTTTSVLNERDQS